ncbi:PP2C family protein-serine/threonine phosphatase [Microbispora sp. NPDC049125]|uniref:PP2C family protein-serine/threonine phosphatase n=1 Tax=Microbispora sp. NPDC049125 TaxID=3154929 RepID=UPI003466DA2B
MNGPSADTSKHPHEAAASWMQALLDSVPVQAVWATPVSDETGGIADFEVLAASPQARDVHGRSGKELIGVRTREAYPGVLDTPLWQSQLRVMKSGKPEEVVRYQHPDAGDGMRHQTLYTVRLARFNGGLLTSWSKSDEEERLSSRLLHTERLGNLGWGRWSLVTGETEWSPQLYSIHRRDPADGPLTLEEYRDIAHPDDVPVVERALEVLTVGDAPHEFEVRVDLDGELRHIRATVEVSRDATGKPVEVHGVIQDITDWRRTAEELAEVSQRLEEESQLTARLQHIIMPVENESFSVPGLRIAVRYIPAETAPLGGDWYQAIPLDQEEVLLAVGDVAGHGLAAASAMAKLRHAITGLAFADHDPAQTLVALNRLLRRMRPDVLATAVVARYRPADRMLTWTHAGHPPILLVRGDTVHRLLHPGVLLGVFEDVSYSTAQLRLEPEDLLLMFTDGLIERPGRDLFDGLEVLSVAVADAVRNARGDRLAAVTRVLTPSNTSDDTCILVARVMPTTMEVS